MNKASWTLDQAPSQAGKIALITGANIGLGYETALGLAQKGAQVILACRNEARGQQALNAILAAVPGAEVELAMVDLSSLADVRRCAEALNARLPRLDLLINNAGIMMPPRSLSEDGFESQFAANYTGHFLLTSLLLPLLEKTSSKLAPARVVSLSSAAHKWGEIYFDDLTFDKAYNTRKSYGQSKLACLMFAYELDRQLRKRTSTVLSVAAHPGISVTNLGRFMPSIVQSLSSLIFQSAARGALPTLYAATGSDINGGDYCGPNGWQEISGNACKVDSSSASKDLAVAERLWILSHTLTQGDFFPSTNTSAQPVHEV